MTDEPIDLDALELEIKEFFDEDRLFDPWVEIAGTTHTKAMTAVYEKQKALISVVRKQREALKDVLREIEIGDQGHDNAVIYTNSPNIKNAREVLSLTAKAKEESK